MLLYRFAKPSSQMQKPCPLTKLLHNHLNYPTYWDDVPSPAKYSNYRLPVDCFIKYLLISDGSDLSLIACAETDLFSDNVITCFTNKEHCNCIIFNLPRNKATEFISLKDKQCWIDVISGMSLWGLCYQVLSMFPLEPKTWYRYN